MRISDWSSDVCSSDLADRAWPERAVAAGEEGLRMDIGDRMIVEQVFDISGRGELAARDARIQRHVVVVVGVIVGLVDHSGFARDVLATPGERADMSHVGSHPNFCTVAGIEKVAGRGPHEKKGP